MHPRASSSVWLLVVSLAFGACSTPGARVHAGFMQTELSGTLGLSPSSPGSGVTSTIDVDDTLGLSDPSGSIHARGELDAGLVRVTASGFRFSESGSGRLTGSFGDIVAGTDVASSLDLLNLKTALTFDVLDTGVVRISPGIAIDLFTVDAQVTEALTSTSERIDEVLPVPMLFAQGEVDLGVVSGTLDLGFLDVDLGDIGGTYFDLEAMISVEPFEAVEFYAGYRYISLDADGTSDGQDMIADLLLRGWFIGGGVHF
jgi:hypothetical protein